MKDGNQFLVDTLGGWESRQLIHRNDLEYRFEKSDPASQIEEIKFQQEIFYASLLQIFFQHVILKGLATRGTPRYLEGMRSIENPRRQDKWPCISFRVLKK